MKKCKIRRIGLKFKKTAGAPLPDCLNPLMRPSPDILRIKIGFKIFI